MPRSSLRATRWVASVALTTALVTACSTGTNSGKLGQNAASGSSSGAAKGSAVEIGVVVSKTGASATLGTTSLQGIQLAADYLNAHGGIKGHKVSLNINDDQSSATQAVTLAQRLVDQNHVAALVGGINGDTAQSISTVAERSHVPFITETGAVTASQDALPYTFFTLAPFGDSVNAMLAYAQKKGYKSMGLLRLSRSYGQLGSQLINAAASKYGITVVDEEQGTDTDTVFTTQLTKIRAAKPDFLLDWFANPAGALILKQAKQLGLNVPVIAPGSMNNADLFSVAGSDADGVVVQSQYISGNPLPRQREFAAAYKKAYNGQAIGYNQAVGWDLVQMIAKAGSTAATLSPADLDKALNNLQYDGAGTVIKYSSSSHLPSADTVVLTLARNNTFEQIK